MLCVVMLHEQKGEIVQTKLLVVQVMSGETRRIQGGEGDRAYDFTIQGAYVSTSGPFPTDIEVMLPKGAAPYPPGCYLIGAGALVKQAIVAKGNARIKVGFESSAPMVPLADAVAELQQLLQVSAANAAAAPRRAAG
jgi:hypothetical protein